MYRYIVIKLKNNYTRNHIMNRIIYGRCGTNICGIKENKQIGIWFDNQYEDFIKQILNRESNKIKEVLWN